MIASLIPTDISPSAIAFIIVGVATTLSLLLNSALIRFCNARGILDYPNGRKRHKSPTPHIGGVTLLLSFTLTALLIGVLFPEYLHLGEVVYVSLLGGAVLVFAVGLIDDLKPVSAWVKLLAQVAAGLVLYYGGAAPEVLSIPFLGEVNLGGWSALIAIVWVVALSNAVNLIDGLDGLASGVSLIGALSLAVILWALQVGDLAMLALALAGSLIGMLYYNLYPARLFLGDSGALLIGYLFAALSLMAPVKSYTTAALFLPLLALAVPLIETFSSFLRRLFAGKSILQADRRHLFHYLGYLGLSLRATVRIFWLAGALSGTLAIGMLFWDRMLAVSVLALVMVAVLGLILILGFRLRKTAGDLRRRSKPKAQ
ncbi:undecaprenyl/decaprenyl-phosphate alpha-N-acetylglucosaminyl 1-phosphate transferase [Gemmatimonas aurantiaca]|nr:undecaprenyl/decaprenyl-phosphate alpha-N-acetylglucosaminyl 1-phosphate transferase [Gemmatimonas aurantiaca]